MEQETNYAADQYEDDLWSRRPDAPAFRRTTRIDPELIVIHEGLIWAAAAILGAGCFSLGYMAGVWGWI